MTRSQIKFCMWVALFFIFFSHFGWILAGFTMTNPAERYSAIDAFIILEFVSIVIGVALANKLSRTK